MWVKKITAKLNKESYNSHNAKMLMSRIKKVIFRMIALKWNKRKNKLL